MAHEVSDYVEQAKKNPSTENLEAMWRSVFLLKAWYFLPARSEEGPNRPMVLQLEGGDGEPGAWLPVFTNVRRYRAFADVAGRVDGEGEMHALMLDPGEAVAKILEFRAAIEGVIFNPGEADTFRAPVEALEEYAEHFDVPYEK